MFERFMLCVPLGALLEEPQIHLRDNVGECLSLQVPFGGSCDVMEQGLGCSSR